MPNWLQTQLRPIPLAPPRPLRFRVTIDSRQGDALPSHQTSQGKHNLDLPQRIEKRLARLNASENNLARWLVELISWTFSALCMGVIIGILCYLRNQPLSKWPLGLTFVTALAKIAAATLIIPTSEAIGQLKWNWFNGGTSKEMFDFEIFDKASRGPWGSMMLLLRTRGKSLAAFGAVLTLLMLAIDTFFQQVVELPERWTLQDEGFVPKVIYYERPGYGEVEDGQYTFEDDENLVALMQAFFFDNGTQVRSSGNGTRADIPVTCPTSNCTWPSYETLGVCSACEDVSSLLHYECGSGALDWVSTTAGASSNKPFPNGTMCGYFLNTTSDNPTMMTGHNTDLNVSYAGEALIARVLPLVSSPERHRLLNGSIHFHHIRDPIEDFVVASVSNGLESIRRNETPVAHECVVHWCVKTIQSSYYWGGYEEEVTNTFANTTTGPFPWQATPVVGLKQNGTDYQYIDNITIQPPSEKTNLTFGLSNDTHANTIMAFDHYFPVFFTMNESKSGPFMRYNTYKTYNYLRVPDFIPWLPVNNVTQHMENFTTAVTNLVRSRGNSNEFVAGHAYENETYVSVQWAWLAFPLALLILSLIFLIVTIARTSVAKGELEIWKTSAIPALIYSLPKDVQKSLTSKETRRKTTDRKRAKKTRIQLLPGKGWRVSGHAPAPTTPVMRRNEPLPGWI